MSRLEDIIYQRNDFENMDLFAKIYDKIHSNDRTRTIEEDKINILVREHKILLDNVIHAQAKSVVREDLFQSQILDLNNQIKD